MQWSPWERRNGDAGMSWYTPTIHGLVEVQREFGAVCFRRKRLDKLRDKSRAEVVVIRYHPDTTYVDYLDVEELKRVYDPNNADTALRVGIYSKARAGFLAQYEPITPRQNRYEAITERMQPV